MKRLGAVFLLFLFGCPGELENPERFMGTPVCTLGIDVPTAIFQMKCGGGTCHGNGAASQAGLDLVSDGVAARLFDMPAAACMARPLVDTSSPAASVLLLRIAGGSECGAAMPLGTNGLPKAEVDCVHAWIADELAAANGGAM